MHEQNNETRKRNRWLKKVRTHSNDIWVAQTKQQSNLRSKLLLKKSSQVLIFFGLTHQLNSHILLLVDASVDSTVPSRSKLGSNEQLRHICTPFLFSFSLYSSTRRDQILWPWHCSLILPKRKPSPRRPSTVRNLFIPMQILHMAGTTQLLSFSKSSNFSTFSRTPTNTQIQK